MTHQLGSVALLIACSVAAVAGADRLTDRDVKALVSRIEDGRNKFDDALDDKLKSMVIRGPSREVKVAQYLDDFQASIDRLEERLKPDYAGSTEAAAVLREASVIDGVLRRQPAGTRGVSEWNRLAADLRVLAAAYGASFPVPEGATPRRLGDRELAEMAEQLADMADRLKNALDDDLKNDTTVDATTRQSIVDDASQLERDAKALRERVNDGDPSSAEAERLLVRSARIRSVINDRRLSAAKAAWSPIAPKVADIAAAYGMEWLDR